MDYIQRFVSSEKKFDEKELLKQLKDAGIIKADITLDELREAAKKMERVRPEIGALIDSNKYFAVWPKQ